MDRETWEATVHGTTELDRTERLSTSSHIGISEVIVISPGNLDSSLWLIQPGKAQALEIVSVTLNNKMTSQMQIIYGFLDGRIILDYLGGA